ncbi:MFS transporter [Petrimonas sp.]|uniref:MFS transporter n=1 Tax=Petrimonas sp. TaxID=2023866 RepID=UPI003F50D56A
MNTKTDQKQNYLLPIIMMIFLFGMIAFVTNLASPMGDILKFQFNVPNWMGTLGVFANFIAYAVMGYPAGNLLQKLGYKKTALIAIAVGFVGVGIQTISGFAGSFGIYLLGAFVAGFSMCLLNVVVNPMLNRLGGGGNKGNQLIQVGGSFNSLAGTAVIILTGILIPNGIKNAQISDVFPLMYTALAIFAFAFLVISLTSIPEKNTVRSTVTPKYEHSPLSFRHFVLGAVGIFVYVGVEVGVPNVLNKWLQNPDLDVLQLGGIGSAEAIAGSVTATYWLLMLFGRLLGAAIGSKVSAKSMLTVASLVGLVLTLAAMFSPTESMVNLPVFKNDAEGLFGLAKVPINAAFLVLVGLCTSVMWGGIFNLAVEGLGKYTEKASGIFMVLVCGGGILPLLQNGIVDMTGGLNYLVSYWVVFVGLAYLLYYALIGSKNVNKNISTVDTEDIPIETTPQSLPLEEQMK